MGIVILENGMPSSQMRPYVTFDGGADATDFASERFLAGVTPDVIGKVTGLFEPFPTSIAHMGHLLWALISTKGVFHQRQSL